MGEKRIRKLKVERKNKVERETSLRSKYKDSMNRPRKEKVLCDSDTVTIL